MSIALITGSAGLIGSEATMFFAEKGFDVVGIDNDMRRVFFGDEASTEWNRRKVEQTLGGRYRHFSEDIRDAEAIQRLFGRFGKEIQLVVHTAAQPSHDWAVRDPHTDFGVNAVGTLNMLEATRRHAPDAVFIFTSTNKVYGDAPNRLPLVEQDKRFEIDPAHTYAAGIREDMPIDQTMHSLFGASKVAADVLVQEYGRYFGMKTACFRGGCLTGPNHSGTQLHGFLAYLMRCTVTGTPYTVFGYQGKQVRDNIHSSDLISAFFEFFKAPRCGAVYNIGGGRHSNCSMLEAIADCERIAGKPLAWSYSETNRTGDHIWWVSDLARFRADYPNWRLQYDVPAILGEIHAANRERWLAPQRVSIPVSAASPPTVTVPATIDHGKQNVLGVGVDAVDYDSAVQKVVAAARQRRGFAVSALAVHGVMTGVKDESHRQRLNGFDLIVPDGQPVRWAMKWLHGVHLPDRVYGPTLMLRLCEAAAAKDLPIYLYGSRSEVLDRLSANLRKRFPALKIAGSEASRFRQLSEVEKFETADRIRESGAAITFVGLGCPRQEVWVHEYRELLPMPLIAVGAAFDFHAGTLSQAPTWMQRHGLEWLYRLSREPARLWRRYLFLNPHYLALVGLQALNLHRVSLEQTDASIEELRYG